LESAVRRFVDGFNNIPIEWLSLVAEHIDKEECYAMPMWGTAFMPHNMDAHNIAKLLRDPLPEDIVGLIEFIEDKGLDVEEIENAVKLIALAASDPDEIDESEVEDLRNAVRDAWRDSSDEEAYLADAGWQDVGGTGFIAREFDGRLVLGVNGAGYDFYESHWRRLYEELGYSWHKLGH